ncbi:hypothetical protein, partial [Escherichia coli]
SCNIPIVHIKSHPEQLRNDYYLTSKVTFNFFSFPIDFCAQLICLAVRRINFFLPDLSTKLCTCKRAIF